MGHSQLKIPAHLGGDWWLLSHFFRVWTTHIYQENLLWWIDLLIPASPHPILLQSMETWLMYLLLVSTPWLSSFTMGRQGKCIVYFIVVFYCSILTHFPEKKWKIQLIRDLIGHLCLPHIKVFFHFSQNQFLLCSLPPCQENWTDLIILCSIGKSSLKPSQVHNKKLCARLAGRP